MRSRFILIIAGLAALLAHPLAAQLAVVPGVQLPRIGLPGALPQGVLGLPENLRQVAERLANERLRVIDRLVRQNRDTIELDASGAPARKGELLVMDAEVAGLERARRAGFAVLGVERVEELGLEVTRLAVPAGLDLAQGERALARVMPGAVVAPDNLHFASGAAPVLPVLAQGTASSSAVPVGMIDGAPGPSTKVAATKGFARGAPLASNHGTAVAGLLAHAGAGIVRVADVYGSDPAGGNALAIARGLGWLVGEGSRVVTISLVGPKNPVLARAVSAARQKGVVVVAAVGNDGPAAPPSYPASYDGVVAVTGVDKRNRALIEAGRALNLDYAAPGADIRARDAKGRRVKLRGTSYATPLVAARAAIAIGAGRDWRKALDAEAVDLGRKGHDDTYGRGLVCGRCRGE